jgi:hypothetical protein
VCCLLRKGNRERGDKDGTTAGGREKIETPGRKETEEKDE